jgi:hypothetical protein
MVPALEQGSGRTWRPPVPAASLIVTLQSSGGTGEALKHLESLGAVQERQLEPAQRWGPSC